MTRRTVMAATLALSVGAVSLLAQGPGQGRGGPGRGPGGMGPGGPGGPGVLARVHQLEDLTDAQKEQIRALAQEGRQGGDPGAGVRATEQKLQAAVLANSPDLQAIETLKTALVTAQAAELDHRVGMMQKVAQILTPAQRQQLLEKQTAGPRGRGRHHSPSH